MEFGARARVTAFIIVVSGGAVLGANHAAWSGQQELDPSGLGRLRYFDFLLTLIERVSNGEGNGLARLGQIMWDV